MAEVDLNAVGSVEDFIQRLINERKSLESAQQMLRMYRMVCSEMQPALDELAKIKESIADVRKDLAGIEGQRNATLARVREEVDQFRATQLGQVNDEIKQKRDELEAVEVALIEMETLKADERASFDAKIAAAASDLERLNIELAQARSEHATLAEAINKTAEFFTRSS